MDNADTVRGVKQRFIWVPVGVAAMLAYGLLTGGPLVPMDDYAETSANLVPEDKLDTLESTFGGKPIEIKGGLLAAASEMKAFAPTDPSVLEPDARPQLFYLTITNNTKKALDLFNVAVVQTDIVGAADAVCTDLFDEAQGITGIPADPLEPGAKVKFPWAMGCPGAEGTKIAITIAITDKEQVKFSGQLA